MQQLSRIAAGLGLLACSGMAFGAGLELTQHGVKEMGHGYAGTATLLEDASAIAFNPAGLVHLAGKQFSGGVSLVHAQLDYDVKVISERVEALYGLDAREVSGPGKATSKQLSPVPHLYFSNKISDNVALGIGLYVPFASGSDFPSGWAGRYHSEETSQQAININPVVSFKLNDQWSFGAGVIAQIYRAHLTNQVDVGYLVAESILDNVANDPTKGPEVAQDLSETVLNKYGSNPNYQVHNEIDLFSVSYGFNFGVLWQPNETWRFGLNYRSQISHISEGEAKRPTLYQPGFRENLIEAVAGDAGYTIEEASQQLEKAFDERGALGGDLTSQVHLPQMLTLSANYRLRENLDLMGSFTWVNWSVFKEMRLEYDDNSSRGGADITHSGDDVRRRDLVQPLHFKDAIRVGVGARWQPWKPVVLRAGYSFDQSPLTDSDYRTPRGPDADRHILGLGMTYQFKKLDIDLAYSRITLAKANVSARENPAGTLHRAQGHSEGLLTVLGMQANYRF